MGKKSVKLNRNKSLKVFQILLGGLCLSGMLGAGGYYIYKNNILQLSKKNNSGEIDGVKKSFCYKKYN
jgi:hypothetical protein